MKTVLKLAKSSQAPLPDKFANDDVRFADELVEYFLNAYTNVGDAVLDPFCGFGTTLKVCERLGRTGIGIEFLEDRVAWLRSTLDKPDSVLLGDATRISEMQLPEVDFVITSPPYTFDGDDTNALKANTEPGQGYDAYLDSMKEVFTDVNELLKPGGRIVIDIENNYLNEPVTFLAWDVAREVAKVLPFEKEVVVIRGEHSESGNEHEYCMVFKKP